MTRSVDLYGMGVDFRHEEFVEVRVVRDDRIVYEFAGRVNTLMDFIDSYRSEVTANSDVYYARRITNMLLTYDLVSTRANVTITPDDITVDEEAMILVLVKLVTITSGGGWNHIYLVNTERSPTWYFSRISIPYTTVNAGDIVYVRYTLRFYLTSSNLGGILSDASLSYTDLVLRLYYRLKGTDTRSLRIAKVEYVDDQGNVVLSVNTNNDSTNRVVRAPLTMVPGTVKIKTVRLCDSSGTALMRFFKPEPAVLPAGSAVKTEVTIQ